MERLFKILRSKFDRFEETPPEGAYENIMNALLDDDNQRKRKIWGGHGFLLFSSLIAVTTLAGTFLLNQENFNDAITGNKLANPANAKEGRNISGNNLVYNKAEKTKSFNNNIYLNKTTWDFAQFFTSNLTSVLQEVNKNFNSAHTGYGEASLSGVSLLAYNYQTGSSRINNENISSNSNTEEILAEASVKKISRKRERVLASRSTAKSKKHNKSRKSTSKSGADKRKTATVYKKANEHQFVVKDPLSVYGQKTRATHFIDSIKLAEIEGEKKQDTKVEIPVMEEARIIQPEYFKTKSRFELSLVIDKMFYLSAVKQASVKTEDLNLKNYRETGSSSGQTLTLQYLLNDNFEIYAGFGHRSLKNSFGADSEKDSVKKITFTDEIINEEDPTKTTDSIITGEEVVRRKLYYIGNNNLNYLVIPFGFNYKKSFGKLQAYAGLGINANILVRNVHVVETKFKSNNELIKNQNNKIQEARNFGLALNPSFGIAYPLNKKLDLRLGTNGFIHLSNLYESNEINSSPLLWGAHLGLNIKL